MRLPWFKPRLLSEQDLELYHKGDYWYIRCGNDLEKVRILGVKPEGIAVFEVVSLDQYFIPASKVRKLFFIQA